MAKVYITVEVADGRYCDDCPLLRVRPGGEDDVGLCTLFAVEGEEGLRRDVSRWPREEPKWLRLPECIAASEDIKGTLESCDIEMGYFVEGER